jgi:hypothetical protein
MHDRRIVLPIFKVTSCVFISNLNNSIDAIQLPAFPPNNPSAGYWASNNCAMEYNIESTLICNDDEDKNANGKVEENCTGLQEVNQDSKCYPRGGKSTGFGSTEGCEGVSCKGSLYYSDQTRWAKEQWHTAGYVFGEYQKCMGPLNRTWLRFKATTYNIQKGDKTAAKLEICDDNESNKQWVKANERIDNRLGGDNGGECGEVDQIITWRWHIDTFRWDNTSNVDNKILV